jgi:hypothetical protein
MPEHDMSRIKAFFRRLIVATHEQGLARGSSAMSVVADGGGIEETLACVREQSALITYAGRMLAANLQTRAVAEGLQSVEDICATLLVTDELIAVAHGCDAGPAGCSGNGLSIPVCPWKGT